jgi:hypothetical protein
MDIGVAAICPADPAQIEQFIARVELVLAVDNPGVDRGCRTRFKAAEAMMRWLEA